MAKKAVKAQRGGGTVEEQIARLKASVGSKGVAEAEKLIGTYEPDVLRLAVKLDNRRTARAGGLGSRIEAMIAALPESEREQARALMMKAKTAAKK